MKQKYYFQDIISGGGKWSVQSLTQRALVLTLVVMVVASFMSLVSVNLRTQYTHIQNVLVEHLS
jgi:hypothetical protein